MSKGKILEQTSEKYRNTSLTPPWNFRIFFELKLFVTGRIESSPVYSKES